MPTSSRPTHAGGVVCRRSSSGKPEFLLVTAKRNPDDWVFPKGHIEAGETPENAAVREVLEEAGVTAEILEPLPDVERTAGGETQRVRYFLMTAVHDAGANEGRKSSWLPLDAAIERLTFSDTRTLLERAGPLAVSWSKHG